MKRTWQRLAETIIKGKKAGKPTTLAEENLVRAYDDYESAQFWSNWTYPEGANPEDIQNELSDYHEMMAEVSEVYMHITRGAISKQNTKAYAVIGVADEVAEKDTKEAVDELKENIQSIMDSF